MDKQKVIISENLQSVLAQEIGLLEHDRIAILTDETTARLCYPLIKDNEALHGAHHICIGATDSNKTLDTLAKGYRQSTLPEPPCPPRNHFPRAQSALSAPHDSFPQL